MPNDLPMKSLTSSMGIGDVLALAGHVVRQCDGLAVAEMRADQVGIVDPAVVHVLAGLHLGLQLLDDVTFLDDVVLELDAGELGERLGQRLRLVFVGRDGLGDDVDLHALEGLGGLGEPLQLLLLLVLRQRRGLEFRDPLLDRGVVGGAHRRRDGQRHRDDGGDAGHRQKAILGQWTFPSPKLPHVIPPLQRQTFYRPGLVPDLAVPSRASDRAENEHGRGQRNS